MRACVCTWLVLALVAVVHADMYLHNPRGSNNRLDEARRDRNNANRLFDSQNNNRGGYNVGSLYYYEGSILPIEWTNQHSCGDQNSHCDVILQYMCEDLTRDGATTNTIPFNLANCEDFNCNTDLEFGMHETFDYYLNCRERLRNKGLFTADQNLRGNRAIYTRQNPNGNRRGYECPEERDYYPYWSPTPWRDIAVLTNDVSRCSHYISESENVKGRGYCDGGELLQTYQRDTPFIPNNQEECEELCKTDPTTGNDTCFEWKIEGSHGLSAPACVESYWSRDNHLGNTVGGYPIYYNWTIPNTPDENCVLRIRYNISTADYDGWTDPNVNSSLVRESMSVFNGEGNTNAQVSPLDVYTDYGFDSIEDAAVRGYVFRQNPVVKVFPDADFGLQLAINTNQFGRTFQDRSHTFAIRERPEDLQGETIYNLNVRGKRGNIVQVYPAVEYDFTPNVLMASVDSYVHIQWTGSNTNPNNNDGQGKQGTDRSNMALLRSPNYPEGNGDATAGSPTSGHWGNSYPAHLDTGETLLGMSRADRQALAVLDSRQFGGEMSELDDAGTYFDLGPRKITQRGTYHYLCTRNNNFTNRSQKGKVIIQDNSFATARLGSTGGRVTVNNHYVDVEEGDLSGATVFQIEEYRDAQDAVDMAEGQGGTNIDSPSGDRYSPYILVLPLTTFANAGESVTLAIDLDSDAPGDVKIYMANPRTNWNFVEMRTSESGGMAMTSTDEGGIYVASAQQDLTFIAGIVVAFVVIVVVVAVVVSTIVYFKVRPEKWAKAKDRAKKAKIRVTRSFATKV